MNLGSYEQFKFYFKNKTGLDLNCYKQAQMQRRIEQFITNKGEISFQAFREHLERDPDLMTAFIRHLTINVSQFFRDNNQWDILRQRILPLLLETKHSLKIWSAGCSAGQEAYTISTILHEYFPNILYSILGTDIDLAVLDQAKSGIYKPGDLQGMPSHLMQKYFRESPAGFIIKDYLKQHVSFQHRNLLTSSFDTGFDLIMCRNVVIYFTEETKNNLYKRFSQSLRSGGILFTGSTEQIFNLKDLGLKAVAPFFYQKTI